MTTITNFESVLLTRPAPKPPLDGWVTAQLDYRGDWYMFLWPNLATARSVYDRWRDEPTSESQRIAIFRISEPMQGWPDGTPEGSSPSAIQEAAGDAAPKLLEAHRREAVAAIAAAMEVPHA